MAASGPSRTVAHVAGDAQLSAEPKGDAPRGWADQPMGDYPRLGVASDDAHARTHRHEEAAMLKHRVTTAVISLGTLLALALPSIAEAGGRFHPLSTPEYDPRPS